MPWPGSPPPPSNPKAYFSMGKKGYFCPTGQPFPPAAFPLIPIFSRYSRLLSPPPSRLCLAVRDFKQAEWQKGNQQKMLNIY